MYEEKIRQLATAFVDAQSVGINRKDVRELSKELNDDRFLSHLIFESKAGPLAGKPTGRIGFRSSNNEWHLALLGERFDFFRLPTEPGGSNLGDFGEFCREAIPKLNIALNFYQRKAHRLAAVQEGVLPKMKPEEMDEIASHLLRLPPTFSQTIPFEWDWRSASLLDRSFAGLTEPTNTIVTVKRESGMLIQMEKDAATHKRFDQIRVDLDINTSPENVKARFGEKEITAFFKECPAWHSTLMTEISDFIRGGKKTDG